ncbi:acyl carrier protein [Candidatus Aerophobetes bacterium]|nr:acyl carrier protein [Candidatus Aerophobetes bacterium]
MPVREKVKKIVAKVLRVPEEKIREENRFVQDLGAESIDSVELMAAFEAEFNIEIPPEEGERVQTVGEAIRYIENKLKEKEEK